MLPRFRPVRQGTAHRGPGALHTLVVVAHPRTDSFAQSIAAAAVAGLTASGTTVHLIDLYASGFSAAMTAPERAAYQTERPLLDAMTIEHAELVRGAERLVFIYPTWWSGLPAILKGWLERVLVTGVAFRFDERTGKVRPALGHVRQIVGISTYGSPWIYVKAINDNGRRILTRALWMACGIRTRRSWLALYSFDTATEQQRAAFLDRVTNKMASLA